MRLSVAARSISYLSIAGVCALRFDYQECQHVRVPHTTRLTEFLACTLGYTLVASSSWAVGGASTNGKESERRGGGGGGVTALARLGTYDFAMMCVYLL